MTGYPNKEPFSTRERLSPCGPRSYSLAGVGVGEGLASAGVTFGLSIRILKSSPSRITDQYPLIFIGPEFWT